MTLVEFLLARITEDEADIQNARIGESPEWWMPDAWSRERALAECEAKRRIIELHSPDGDGFCDVCIQDSNQIQDMWVQEQTPCRTLRLLAAPYSGHPDYQEEWKP